MAILKAGFVDYNLPAGGLAFYAADNLGFVPGAILFMTVPDDHGAWSSGSENGVVLGVSVPGSEACAVLSGKRGSGTTKTYSTRYTDHCVAMASGAGTLLVAGNVTARYAESGGGFGLRLQNQHSAAWEGRVYYLAFADSVSAHLHNYTLGSLASQVTTGFRPRAIIALGQVSQATGIGNGILMGFADGDAEEFGIAATSRNNVGTTATAQALSNQVIVTPNDPGGVENSAEVLGFTDTGYTIQPYEKGNGIVRVSLLALGGPLRARVVNQDTQPNLGARPAPPGTEETPPMRAAVAAVIALANAIPGGPYEIGEPHAHFSAGWSDLSNRANVFYLAPDGRNTQLDDSHLSGSYVARYSPPNTSQQWTSQAGIPMAVRGQTQYLGIPWTGTDDDNPARGYLVLGEAMFAELAGSAAGSSGAAVALRQAAKLAGSAAGSALAAAPKLTREVPLAGSAAGSALAAATRLRVGAALAGSVVPSPSALATAKLSAVLTVTGSTGGTSAAYASDFRTSAALAGTAEGTSGSDTWLGPVARLAGSSAGSSTVPPTNMVMQASLTGSAGGTVTFPDPNDLDTIPPDPPIRRSWAFAVGLAMDHPLTGEAAGWSLLIASTHVPHPLSGDSPAGGSDGLAWLTMAHALTGVAQAGKGAALLYETRPMPVLRDPEPGEYPGTVNLIPNPSAEYEFTGMGTFTVTGGETGGVVPERDESQAWDGEHSAFVAVPAEASTWTVRVRSLSSLGFVGGEWFVGQVALLGDGGAATVRTEIVYADGGANPYDALDDVRLIDLPDPDQNEPWLVLEPFPVQGEPGRPVAYLQHVIEIQNDGSNSRRLWIDGAQIEVDRGHGTTPFADGDNPDGLHAWFGARGHGFSVRQPAPAVG